MTEPSARALKDMTAENSGECPIDLLTFTHPDLDPPIRLTNDKTEILSIDGPHTTYCTRSRGAGGFGPDAAEPVHMFQHLPFSVIWPGYEEGAVPEIRIAIDMIDRNAIVPILRTFREGRVRVFVESVLAADPDVVTGRHRGFYLRRGPWDGVAAQLGLQLIAYDVEPYPVGMATPTITPGLFP